MLAIKHIASEQRLHFLQFRSIPIGPVTFELICLHYLTTGVVDKANPVVTDSALPVEYVSQWRPIINRALAFANLSGGFNFSQESFIPILSNLE